MHGSPKSTSNSSHRAGCSPIRLVPLTALTSQAQFGIPSLFGEKICCIYNCFICFSCSFLLSLDALLFVPSTIDFHTSTGLHKYRLLPLCPCAQCLQLCNH